MPNVAKKACPGFFTCEGLIADLFCDAGISPHRCHVAEVVEAVSAQSEAFGFDDRNLHADMLSFFGMHVLYRDDPDRQTDLSAIVLYHLPS